MSLLEAHYRAVRERRDYDPVDAVGDLAASSGRHRFAFADDADELAAATPADTLVSVGVSPSGTPHVGTLGQVETAVDLQRAGFDVQLVIADLVVYNAGGDDIETLRARADRYREFAVERGFDPDRGRLYAQDEAHDVTHAAVRLASHYDPDAREGGAEETEFEAALADAYDDRGDDGGGSDATAFSRDLCGLLMAADNVRPLAEGYDRVVLTLGADNAGLAREFDAVRERAGVSGSVTGLYTRLVGGVDDTPKMSKSIPGSSVHLGTAPERLRDRVADPALDAERPAESVVFQMMRLASPYSGDELDELADACAENDDRWTAAVGEYADYLAEAAEAWRETG